MLKSTVGGTSSVSYLVLKLNIPNETGAVIFNFQSFSNIFFPHDCLVLSINSHNWSHVMCDSAYQKLYTKLFVFQTLYIKFTPGYIAISDTWYKSTSSYLVKHDSRIPVQPSETLEHHFMFYCYNMAFLWMAGDVILQSF